MEMDFMISSMSKERDRIVEGDFIHVKMDPTTLSPSNLSHIPSRMTDQSVHYFEHWVVIGCGLPTCISCSCILSTINWSPHYTPKTTNSSPQTQVHSSP